MNFHIKNSLYLIYAIYVILSHYIPSLSNHDRHFSLSVFAIIPLSLWIVGTVFIQNPYNSFASNVDPEAGNEEIEFANLFFFALGGVLLSAAKSQL